MSIWGQISALSQWKVVQKLIFPISILVEKIYENQAQNRKVAGA